MWAASRLCRLNLVTGHSQNHQTAMRLAAIAFPVLFLQTCCASASSPHKMEVYGPETASAKMAIGQNDGQGEKAHSSVVANRPGERGFARWTRYDPCIGNEVVNGTRDRRGLVRSQTSALLTRSDVGPSQDREAGEEKMAPSGFQRKREKKSIGN